MNNQQTETIKAIQEADITQDDWFYAILPQITDGYARGYLQCKAEQLAESLSTHEEEFRDEILSTCGYNIWGQ